jgi:hypothetical protein
VGIKADHTDIALGALGNGFADRVGAAGRVLADYDGNGPGVQDIIHLGLDRSLRPQDVLDRGDIIGLGRDLGIAVIDDLELLQNVDIEILHVAGISN